MEISVEHLREQRGRPAVLKTELARIRSHDKCTLVFVMEGWDDAKAYDVWFRRLEPSLKWESIVAKGKKNALAFRRMLERDATGLRHCTFFIVDHDYDGLAGSIDGPDIYVLPAHSIENLLTHTDVLASLLTTEFRLIGDPQAKSKILKLYEQVRTEFTNCVRPACEILHASTRGAAGNIIIDDRNLEGIQVKLNTANVSNQETLGTLVRTEQELGQNSIEAAHKFFDAADLGLWIRGKFMMWFFKEWCTKLMIDRQAATPSVFVNAETKCSFSGEWSATGSLAAKSPLPPKLGAFIRQASQDCSAICNASGG